ncbi:MAG: hypothetical protein WCT02_02850 [Candidatus Paceibacterota bacterium]
MQIPQSLGDLELGPQEIYKQFGDRIKAKLIRMNPETIGAIAWYGSAHQDDQRKTSLYQVHCQSYLGKYQSGPALMVEIAATALVAEIYDTLRSSEYWLPKWSQKHRGWCEAKRERDRATIESWRDS